jgi:hypothetical protein
MMKSPAIIAGLVMIALGLTGCSSVPSAQEAAKEDPWLVLAKDMTAEQVRAALGPPIEVRPMKTSGGEIWIYRQTRVTGVGLYPVKTQDIPSVNPRTGEEQTIPNPVYNQETRSVEEELQLLMFDGKLVTWNRSVLKEQRRYE